MIQRIQTIYFLLASLAFGAMFLLPMAQSNVSAAQFFTDQEYTITDNMILLGLTILGACTAITAIFLYNKRPIQIKLGYIVVLLATALPLTSYLLLNQQISTLDATVQVNQLPGILIPLGGLLFGILAIRNIRKDEKLVKSMDRLR
jgi:hypothetical protein